jgi:hypothetical protein
VIEGTINPQQSQANLGQTNAHTPRKQSKVPSSCHSSEFKSTTTSKLQIVPPPTNTSTLTNKPFAHLPIDQSTDMKMMSSNPGRGKDHSMIGMPPGGVASKESANLTIGNTRYGRKTILLVLLGVVAVTAGLTSGIVIGTMSSSSKSAAASEGTQTPTTATPHSPVTKAPTKALTLAPTKTAIPTTTAPTLSRKTCGDGLELYMKYLSQSYPMTRLMCEKLTGAATIPSSIGQHTKLTRLA